MERKCSRVLSEVKKVIKGKETQIEMMLAAILAGGHILLDDIPGVGKTSLAMSFSRAMELQANRMQFTSDVLPADVVGFHMIDENGQKQYQPGVVLCNLFLADEINRASSKTQSALLEVMEEGKVTVEGVTMPAPQPFVVVATENPIGSIGTQKLPESQMDRFMICLTLGYPSHEQEIRMLMNRNEGTSVEKIQKVIEREELIQMQQAVKEIHIHANVYDYLVSLAEHTRTHAQLELGLSPRGTIALMEISKALAYMNERDCVYAEDVNQAFPYVARHRVLLTARAKMEHVDMDDILNDIVRETTLM